MKAGVPGPDEIRGSDATRPDSVDAAGSVWPCASCGRPVPQPLRGARTLRYCTDNGGACADEAQGRRERGKETPGLPGQVAWAWEIVQRLEGAADQLAGSLASELSVAGVERRVSEARAEAASHVAAAQEELDAAQRQAKSAWQEAASARLRAEVAEKDCAAARTEAEQACAARDAADQEMREARRAAEESKAARLAAENERSRVAEREGELLAALEAARAELVTLHSRLSESDTLVEGQRIEAAAARRAAEDLRSAVRDAEAKRGQAVADLDQAQARVRDCEQQNWRLNHTVDELRATLAALAGERDAARSEAERARRHIDALTRGPAAARGGETGPATIPDGRTATAIEQEPPTGLHSLSGFQLPHAG
ncbi:chromosome segregation ATPase [Actinomadura barringtoniae]|uniref:Chromosome segregation ATPase n=1 Tax=Actinomadura barringtoniae TaxID=1427535 RepID=A0A939T3G0_9ACTN|nr:chromosome segregation ATPase [Actinomadura barringtoniae]MBO2451086.1 chromosome segregation ATPase [Actinomadura barringtoniae]